jgi:putative transposase
VVWIFPNRASCLRLASALLKEWHEDWVTGRCYLRMEALAEWDSASETERSLGEAA